MQLSEHMCPALLMLDSVTLPQLDSDFAAQRRHADAANGHDGNPTEVCLDVRDTRRKSSATRPGQGYDWSEQEAVSGGFILDMAR